MKIEDHKITDEHLWHYAEKECNHIADEEALSGENAYQ